LFNYVLNSTASNRKATENSCTNKQPSDAELARRKNIRKAKGGIKVHQPFFEIKKKKKRLKGSCMYKKI